MAGGRLDYPEHFDSGLKPHSVQERYYFARGPQLVNRIVDISGTVDEKVEANRAIITQGPGGNAGSNLRKSLASQGKILPILGDDDITADKNYIKHIVLDIDSKRLRGVPSDKEIGSEFGLEWAERFHYIGADESNLQKYIQDNVIAK